MNVGNCNFYYSLTLWLDFEIFLGRGYGNMVLYYYVYNVQTSDWDGNLALWSVAQLFCNKKEYNF